MLPHSSNACPDKQSEENIRVTDIQEKSGTVLEQETNEQIGQRKAKLAELRQQGQAYPNDFKRDSLAQNLHDQYGSLSDEALDSEAVAVKVAGRMMLRRVMGKASFAHIQDMSGQIQLYIARDELPEGVYSHFKQWDLGDIVAAEGLLFRTKTGELSVKVKQLRLLTKALRPLPDKYHGLHDHEQRFRQRYLDLITNPEARRIFQIRSKVVSCMRHYFHEHGFLEVETPMMQTQPGGAVAKPFKTHHNALDLEMYLRIAPELYLKRLVIGGFEKVFEINRNFRNEGISTRHNPEFTMVEFYQAYADYNDLIAFTEAMFRYLASEVLGSTAFECEGIALDFAKPFQRFTLKQAILNHCQELTAEMLDDESKAREFARQRHITLTEQCGLGRVQTELFEALVEDQLQQPTFITEFPAEVSPLARANDENPFVTDRFELFICGKEIANGFSELNDPEDQAQRFNSQLAARAAGDEEAMSFDEDYILALEYGLPPTAGEGIGIDRLVMLLANCASIREVILFPLLRPKQRNDS